MALAEPASKHLAKTRVSAPAAEFTSQPFPGDLIERPRHVRTVEARAEMLPEGKNPGQDKDQDRIARAVTRTVGKLIASKSANLNQIRRK